MSKRFRKRDSKSKSIYATLVNKYAAIIILILTGICIVCFWKEDIKLPFRLDQQASSIAGIIIGVIGSMFGLTAASYAFIWGEIKSEGERNIRLECILECYREKLWLLFVNTLILTFSIVIFNLIILGLIQNITDSTLFYEYEDEVSGSSVTISSYLNEQYSKITLLVIVDLCLSAITIILMGNLNYNVFNRSRYYRNIAKSILKRIQKYYDLDLPKNFPKKEQMENKNYSFVVELNKIYYLELLMSRILKNHESEFEAYYQKDNDEQFIVQIVFSKLRNSTQNWGHILNEKKRKDLYMKCSSKINNELEMIKNLQNKSGKDPILPTDVGFVRAYKDLILYRNAKLMYENNDINGTMLKCTIKSDY